MNVIDGFSAATVLGNVLVDKLGVVLPHEHIFLQGSLHSGKPDNDIWDVDVMVEELRIFKSAGGGTICDVTPVNLGRDARALQEASRRSGVHIVSGVGLYQLEIWKPDMLAMSSSELTAYLIRECSGEFNGVPAGLIGEIASHNEPQHADWRRYRLTEKEKDVFKAVAAAQQATGLWISTHASCGRHGVAQLRCLADAGADTSRVVIGHCDAQYHPHIERDLEYYHELMKFGATLEFDMFGWDEMGPDSVRIERLAALVKEGHGDRLLVSTDTCRRSQLHYRGGRGFDYLFEKILPGLRSAGISEEELHTITVANPGRILARTQTR